MQSKCTAQYTSQRFRAALGVRASMTPAGSCFDNATAEAFFATFKAEIGTQVWDTRDQARPGRVRVPQLLQPQLSTFDTRVPRPSGPETRSLVPRPTLWLLRSRDDTPTTTGQSAGGVSPNV